jgi:hypothetical protein
LPLELGVGELLPAPVECGLDALLDGVDRRAARLLLLHGERGEGLEQVCDPARLAEEARLGVLQICRCGRQIELLLRGRDERFEVVHVHE